MDMTEFIAAKYEWSYAPCLYIVKQMFEGNNAFRAGCSGTMMYKDSDRVWGSDKPGSLSGLLSRCQLYMGFWTPLKGTIYAALRIKQQLVAKKDERVIQDFTGNKINVNRGSNTLVRVREADFHSELDRRGLRWDPKRRNELFVPGIKGVEELIACLRTVKGETMYLFDKDGPREDVAYRGGSSRFSTKTIDTNQKQMQSREVALEAKAPQITLKLTRKAIESLRIDSPAKFATLIDIIDAVYKRPLSGSFHVPNRIEPPPKVQETTPLQTTKAKSTPKSKEKTAPVPLRRSARLNPSL